VAGSPSQRRFTVNAEHGKTVGLDESRSGKRYGLSITYPGPPRYAQVGLERSDLPGILEFVETGTQTFALDSPPDEGGRFELAWNAQRNRLRLTIEPTVYWEGDLPFAELRREAIDALPRGLRNISA
jgi:hypothetical protein